MDGLSRRIVNRLLQTFQDEAADHLRVLTSSLEELEEGPPADQIPAVVEACYRAAHTLKGAARSVKLLQVEAVCQTLETVLARLHKGEIGLDAEVLGQIRQGISAVQQELASALEVQDQTTAGPAPPTAPVDGSGQSQRSPASGTVRASVGQLDTLIAQVEQLLVTRLAVERQVGEASRLVAWFETTARSSQAEIGEGEQIARNLQKELLAESRSLARDLVALREGLHRLRMAAASTIFALFPPMVRDLAREEEKEVEFVITGSETGLDRRVLDALKDPLIHLLRNAVSHGIELPAVRIAAGKRPCGKVSLRCRTRDENRVEITIEDDGAGVDLEAVRAAAVRARLTIPAELEQVSDDAVLQFIFRSGFSTRLVISNISGRGLGLSIVREQVERIGGEVQLETRRGAGTRFTLLVPSSVTTNAGVVVREGTRQYLIPQSAVLQVGRFSEEHLSQVAGREMWRTNGQLYPVVRLARLLEQEADPGESTGPSVCVLIEHGGKRVGLLVDQVLRVQEVLSRQFEYPLVRVRHVSGVGILSAGESIPILRPADLVQSAQSTLPASRHARPDRKGLYTLLLVDDSITTRTMEKSILETAGYKVITAADGLEAWSLLQAQPVDLVVSDIDMPRLNGYELTLRIRSHPSLHHLPVVLVTAMESREDKERGIEVGANGYVVKSTFDQFVLLEVIQRLLNS